MFRRLLIIVNVLLLLLTILLVSVSKTAPSQQYILTGTSLFLPGLIVANALFFLYWLLRLRVVVLLELVFFVVFFTEVKKVFHLAWQTSTAHTNDSSFKEDETNALTLSTFNVHYYTNAQNESKPIETFFDFFHKKNVDVFGLQEAQALPKKMDNYPYHNFAEKKYSKSWLFSRLPKVGEDILNFSMGKDAGRRPFTYMDIVSKNDTIRIYNCHFESYRFSKNAEELQKQKFSTFRTTVNKVFKIHENQTKELINHIKKCPYPVVVMGDFNNNAFSYQYQQLIAQCNLKDTFTAAGNGFGATFGFKYFPTRIDFILVPQSAKVLSHQVFSDVDWSDHYPVISKIQL